MQLHTQTPHSRYRKSNCLCLDKLLRFTLAEPYLMLQWWENKNVVKLVLLHGKLFQANDEM